MNEKTKWDELRERIGERGWRKNSKTKTIIKGWRSGHKYGAGVDSVRGGSIRARDDKGEF